MGNSPSRNELNGDHMSAIANNSGQETFQSHSYPAKFSSVPGIHNETLSVKEGSSPQPPQPHASSARPEFTSRNGRQSNSGGPNTPDLLYSMDSLNVCGNPGTSITSAELPPSSISPQNCRDPWSPSSFSDESLHTQCRNLSRIHKDLHQRSTDDEGMSSSTFEGDSLMPDATLSRPLYFQQQNQGTLRRREDSPQGGKPEVAQEATEFVDVALLPVELGQHVSPIDHSITINGRKVSDCEETPLPPNGNSSKVEGTPSESPRSQKTSPPPPLLHSTTSSSCSSSSGSSGIYSNGTIKRGRMKSPPPPPPPARQNGSAENLNKMSTLNTRMRRNLSLDSSARKSCGFAEPEKVTGKTGEEVGKDESVNVLQAPPLATSSLALSASTAPTAEVAMGISANKKIEQEAKLIEKPNEKLMALPDADDHVEKMVGRKALAADLKNDSVRSGGGNVVGATASGLQEHLVDCGKRKVNDSSTDIAIRPCELSQQLPSRSDIQAAISSSSGNGNSSANTDEALLVGAAALLNENETVNEQMRNGNGNEGDTQNKTELGCKDASEDEKMSGRSTAAATSVDEIKPVSCESSAEVENSGDIKEEKNGSSSSSQNENEEDVGVDFPEMTELQLDTGRKNNAPVALPVAMMLMFDTEHEDGPRRKKKATGNLSSKFEAKFGTGVVDKIEDTPLKSSAELGKGDADVGCSSPGVLGGLEGFNGDRRGSREERGSNSSSRRDSVSSSAGELNGIPVGGTNGILNCNRMSLCSLQDNQGEGNQTEVNFDSPPPPMLDCETIRDQPLGWKSNKELLKGDSDKECEKSNDEGESRKGRNGMLENFLQGHQRKLSMSKVDFSGKAKSTGEKRTVASSAPSTNGNSPFCKVTLNRKASFPELYVNTAIVRPSVQRKHSVGASEKVPRESNHSFFFSNGEKGDMPYKSQFAQNDFLQTLGEIYACKSKMLGSKTKLNAESKTEAPKDVAVPSQIITSIVSANPGGDTASLDPVPIIKSKSREASMDTVDGFECQDRSISEYNISPRSARELVTESLLNGSSSIASSTVSQVSIVTINDSDQPTPPVPFGQGVEIQNPLYDGVPSNGDIPNVVIPRLTDTNGNSATFRKKPGFSRSRVSKGTDSLPSVEIFEPGMKKQENLKGIGKSLFAPIEDIQCTSSSSGDEKSGMPAPPPMPPLQYCRNNSYPSTASSSLGDSSSTESNEKSKSPCFEDHPQTNGKLSCSPNSSCSSKARISPDRTALPKLNGNGSSECSLIELNVHTQKSTSDAIILELKKAQAKKLKFAGVESSLHELSEPAQTSPIMDNLDHISRKANNATVAVVHVSAELAVNGSNNSGIKQEARRGLLEDSNSNLYGRQIISDHVTEPPVKAIVNGKHTNSIIVCDAPVVEVPCKKEVLKRTRSGVHNPTKPSLAQPRGNIMSPSLSGNYTEMNGIDSETMGASSIHEDELSGQMQQKENHINELHGNVDEVQTSNKLDGASFRRVLSEYEKTLSMFIQQIDQLKQRMDEAETEKQTLIKERDQALEDLRNVESAFSDVHRKYERAKALLENMKSNEDTLIRRDQEMMQRIQNRDKKIDMIKEKAQESIEKMHLDYETRIKEMEFENAKLRAQYRKMEMKLSTLENDVEQKAKENAQLSALCDELINGQVGQV